MEIELEVAMQINIEVEVKVAVQIVVLMDLTDTWTGQKISEQRRMKRRLDIRHVMRNMLREQQDVVIVMVVVNERNKPIVRRIKLLC
jgi:hypothetical protein